MSAVLADYHVCSHSRLVTVQARLQRDQRSLQSTRVSSLVVPSLATHETRSRASIPGGRSLCHAGVYEFPEAERIKYAIRLLADQILPDRIVYLGPVGRPPSELRLLEDIWRLIAIIHISSGFIWGT